jgi:hypothetical protein
VGSERGGKIQVLNAVSESWTGMGVVAGMFACVVMVPWPRLKIGDGSLLNQVFLDTTRV